jgi:hypothetical protein
MIYHEWIDYPSPIDHALFTKDSSHGQLSREKRKMGSASRKHNPAPSHKYGKKQGYATQNDAEL